MKWGFQCSGPREPIGTKFCRGGQVWTEMPHANFGGSRFIGLGAVGGTNFRLSLSNKHGL